MVVSNELSIIIKRTQRWTLKIYFEWKREITLYENIALERELTSQSCYQIISIHLIIDGYNPKPKHTKHKLK